MRWARWYNTLLRYRKENWRLHSRLERSEHQAWPVPSNKQPPSVPEGNG